MATVRFYLYILLVLVCLAATPLLTLFLLSLPPFDRLPVYACGLSLLPLTLLVCIGNGNLLLARLIKSIGFPGAAERFYLLQVRIEKLRCHPDEFRIDYVLQELAELYLLLGEVERAERSTWSICDWKEKNSFKSDPEHTQTCFSFAKKLIAHSSHKDAQEFLQKLIQRRKKVFGDTHPAVGEAYLHLGNCYTICDAELALAAYESALPCFYSPQLDLKEKSCVYSRGKKLRSEIVYLRVTAFSNLASLAYSLGDLDSSSNFLEKCTYELQENKLSTMMLSNCRDIVLAQRAQILIDKGRSDQMPLIYHSFKRPVPAASRVGLVLEQAKRNARLLSDRWAIHFMWYPNYLYFWDPFGISWATSMSHVAVIAAHRE